MAATTFLTGQEPAPPATPAPAAPPRPRLSLADGLRLLKTPSSESGVQTYHRVLQGAPPDPEVLLAELAALREGRSTRFELLAEIAASPQARARGLRGPGWWLIRAARKGFIASGAAGRVRATRAAIAQAEAAARAGGGASALPADVLRKLVVLEGAVVRLENRFFAAARAAAADPAVAALESRVEALEAELRRRIEAEGEARQA